MTVTYGEYRAYQSKHKLWYADDDLRDVYIFRGDKFLMQAVCKAMSRDELQEYLQGTVDNFLPWIREKHGDR